MLEFFYNFTFKTSYDKKNKNCQNSIRAHVGHRAFATLKIELYRVVDYDSKWSTKLHKDCILDFLFNFQNSESMSSTELLQHSKLISTL